jgi:hypothetical protein
MTPEPLGQIHWTLVLVRRQRYQRPMDDGAQAPHAVAMNATYAVQVTEPALPPIAALPSIAEVAVMTRLPAASSPASQTLPNELSAGEGMTIEVRPSGPLKNASIGRHACLFRHWTWANRRSSFGAYYLWCALLCGFTEAALEHAILSDLQLASLRADLEASLPGLRACRQLLVVIPVSFEEHPRIVDLLHDHETLGRLRRIHSAFGDALREEQLSRQLEWLLYEH